MPPTVLPPSGASYEASVPLLSADPDFARGLPEDVVSQVGSRFSMPVVGLTQGGWGAPWLPGREVEVTENRMPSGLLVLGGLLLREVRVHQVGRRERAVGVELLGPGDLVRPWQDEDGELLRCSSRWQVLEPARLALLDHDLLKAVGEWPGLTEELLTRCLRRSRWLTVMTALNSAATTRERLVLCFEHLADRWGRVTPAGVRIALPLTHQLLAQLTEMTRPSCTTALTWLAKHEILCREPEGAWLLSSGAHDRLASVLEAESRAPRADV